MSLYKEKIRYGCCLRFLNSAIIKIKPCKCEDYIDVNNTDTLSKEDFEFFSSELLNIRLIILIGLLNENESYRKLKIPEKQFIEMSGRSLAYALRHNGFSSERAEKIVYKFLGEYNEFVEYLRTITKKQISENGYVFYACMCFLLKMSKRIESAEKLVVISELIEKNKNIVKQIFSEIYTNYDMSDAI